MTTYPSLLNSNIYIYRDNWAVTMICNSQSSNRPATSSFGDNHAMLAIEGVKKSGEVFRQFVHLMGPLSTQEQRGVFIGSSCVYTLQRIGAVEIKSNIKSYRYTHKSETWVRPADQVRLMRREAKQERDRPSEFPRAFSIFGNRSIFSTDLKAFKITDPTVTKIASVNKALLKYFYNTAKQCIETYTHTIFDDPYFFAETGLFIKGCGFNIVNKAIEEMSAEVTGNGKTTIEWKYKLGAKRIKEIRIAFLETKTTKDRENLIIETEKKFDKAQEILGAIDISDKRDKDIRFQTLLIQQIDYHTNNCSKLIKKYFDKVSAELDAETTKELLESCNGDMLCVYRKVLKLVADHTDLQFLKPDSCFTWAREKLSIVDVALEDVGIEHIISPTKMYLEAVNKDKRRASKTDNH